MDYETYARTIEAINFQLQGIANLTASQAWTGCADASNPDFVAAMDAQKRLTDLSARLSAQALLPNTQVLRITGPGSAVNPIADLGSNTDECLMRLIFGANTRYIALDLLATLKAVAVKAMEETPDLTIRKLVDCWRDSPNAAINGVRDVAAAVQQEYLP